MSVVPPAAPLVTAASAAHAAAPALPGWLRPVQRVLDGLHKIAVFVGMLALLVAAGVLTSSVLTRYFLQASTDWQDEAAVFTLVAATFLSAGYVQKIRGHVGIEAVAGSLPARLNRVRQALVDLLCLAFCSFFAWKSWTLWHEAWTEGQTTSSSWAPPLWIPYGFMAVGMTLLSVQLLVHALASLQAMTGKASR